jgi:CAAX prenyl protease-like protein
VTARIAPFAAYLSFIALGEILQQLQRFQPEGTPWSAGAHLWLYPVKTVVVLGLLVYFWPRYEELHTRPVAGAHDLWLTLITGVMVYLGWVHLDWPWAVHSQTAGYDPYVAGSQLGTALAGIRLFGAAAVVPVMEELFWRSFLIRYLISPRFESVKLGTLTPFAVTVTLILFAVEHDRWLAGLMAGAAYTMLLYWTQRLWPCILAHSLTNLLLGVHVLLTREWQYW